MDEQIKRISQFDDERLYEYFYTEPLGNLHSLKLYSDDLYYNTGKDSGFKDYQYDMLKNALEERDPGYVTPVGVKIRESENRVQLPYWVGSMDKKVSEDPRSIFKKEQETLLLEYYDDTDEMYDVIDNMWIELPDDMKRKYEGKAGEKLENNLRDWTKKNKSDEYILEYKLDGVSCLLLMDKGKIKLYTRGDGVIGADISYLAQYFDTIPKNTGLTIAVRGELIMKKEIFEKKYSKDNKNPRNMVSGRLGGKTIRKGLTDIDFVAYEIVGNGKMPKPYDYLQILASYGFNVVYSEVVTDFNVNTLTKDFIRFKQESPYEIDGLIVHVNKQYIRNKTGNPSYAFAFKLRSKDNMKIVEVLDIEWNISKWGVIKPRIKIEPTLLGGVTINYASGHNAKYISDNNIGPGSKVTITRSGDVIPFVIEINSSTYAKMPSINYDWNETGVDIYAIDGDPIMCIKLIANFFDKLGIKHLGEATVRKMYENGLDTLLKIISADKERFMKIKSINEKSAERIYTNIASGLQDVSISNVLGSSGIFGFGMGRKRIESLMKDIPDILEICHYITNEELKERIMTVDGFSDKTADKIVDSVIWASKFIDALGEHATFQKVKQSHNDIFTGMTFVFSGFRDAKLESLITDMGGKISTSVSGKTSAVIASDKNNNTGKVKKAREKNVDVYDRSEFTKKFDLSD